MNQLHKSFYLKDISIEIKRGHSFAPPEYCLVINGLGHVKYNGLCGVKVLGEYNYRIPIVDIINMIELALGIDFFSLKNDYTEFVNIKLFDNDQITFMEPCRLDASYNYIKISIGKITKEIKIFDQPPYSISLLLDLIDRLSESHKLTGTNET